ncbi:kinase [Actinomadura adrarensis]|uniref:Kinase n=1 Tax=Actinomadura adrarensis TaxID=1819600 RepID=A0ABW3C942_9ACTN
MVLRGNSGSGKTSVAKTIREAHGRRDLAIVSQDVIRRQILRELDVPGGANIDLLDTIVRWSIGHGYHVVLEGILTASRYGPMLEALRRDHPGQSHWFYLDIPFQETVRRHATRPQFQEFTADQMAEWYRERDLLDGEHETIIGPEWSLVATVKLIMKRSRLGQVVEHD